MTQKFKYSEIFGNTIQGEGEFTGIPTVWVRFFGCNFKCLGFGQSHLPREQWREPAEELNINDYNDINDLPVFEFGCDSSYSWSKRFSHLAKQKTASDIADELENFLKNKHNPNGLFKHPKSGQWTHLAFTGGEPLMNQTGMAQIFEELQNRNNRPNYITIETNGTQQLRNNFLDAFEPVSQVHIPSVGKISNEVELFWSISPKLSASGESWNDAIKPEIVSDYYQLSNRGQLKYVVDGSEKCWDEVDRATSLYRQKGIEFPVWIMPAGATEESQEEIQAKICEEACERGYNTAARVHAWIFSNAIGK